jgi:hypothetical protein
MIPELPLEENYFLAEQRYRPFGSNAKPGGRCKDADQFARRRGRERKR